jgi:hypothetical protein
MIHVLCAAALAQSLLATPTVTITSPADSTIFFSGDQVVITVDAVSERGIARVEFFADRWKIGESTNAPYSFTWMLPEDGRYDLRARAYDTVGNRADSAVVKIVVGTDLAPYVLFIGKLDGPPTNAFTDALVVRHLQSFGLDVQVIDDDAVLGSQAEAEGKRLIVNSSTVTSGLVGSTFYSTPVPFLNWEGGLQDDMQMSTDMAGDVDNQTDLTIVNPGHPLAAGLAAGTYTVVTGGPNNWTAGNPNQNGQIIATLASNPARGCFHVYEPGAALLDGTPAPALRMHIFFRDTTFGVLNQTGRALFDAAVLYALGATPPTVNIVTPTNAQAFGVGESVSITATASAGSNAVDRVYFYLDGAKIGEDTTSPYTGTWTNAIRGVHTISVVAKDALGLERLAEITVNVGDVTPPGVVITSPTNNSAFAAGANVPITVNAGDATRVEYFANGTLIGESTNAPFNFTFTMPTNGTYNLRARAYDAAGNAGDSALVTIKVGDAPPTVLLIVANPTGTGAGDVSDQAVRDHLIAFHGLAVQMVDDNVVQTSDAQGKQLIISSSTVSSGNVGSKFRDTAVPYINWEAALQDDMGMVPTGGDGFDRPGQTELEIVDPAHPLAAGLAAGVHMVVNDARGFTAGRPTTNAQVVATMVGNLSEACIYVYEPGALLANGTPAPARRIHIFFQDTAFAGLSAAGFLLFDAAIEYALGSANLGPLTIQRVGGTARITWPGRGRLQEASGITGSWSDLTLARPNEYENLGQPDDAVLPFNRLETRRARLPRTSTTSALTVRACCTQCAS